MSASAAAVTAVVAAVVVGVALASTGSHSYRHERSLARTAPASSEHKLPTGYTKDGSAQNKAAAEIDASHLLSLVRLPPAATRLRLQPRGGHGYLAYSSADDTKVAAGWWTVPLSPAALIKYVERHRPEGGHRYMTGFGENYKTGTNSVDVAFEWRLQRYRLGSRTVEVTATRLSDGKTGVLVYASAQWWVLRSIRERVPQAVRRIEIRVAGWHKRRGVTATISAPQKVQRTVSLINSFPLAGPLEGCALEFPGPLVSIRLLGSAGRQIGAIGYMDQPSRLAASESSCNAVSFTLQGHQMPSLIGERFMWTLQKLAGKSLVGQRRQQDVSAA
jgi:hypothetical protein